MVLSADNVRVAVSGAVMAGPYATTAPTGTGGTTTGHLDLGYVTEDGVTITKPGAGDSTPIKAWQNGATVRTIRSTTDDLPTIEFTLMETNIDVVEAALGVSVTSGATEGHYDIDTSETPVAGSWIVDVVDGAELIRSHAPKATPVGEVAMVYKNDEAIGYSVTLECERDTTAGYNIRTWATALKTP